MKKTATILLLSTLLFSCGSDSNDSEGMSSEDLKDISADCDCAQIDYKRNAFGEPIKGSLLYNINTEKVFSGSCEEKWGDDSRKEIRQYSNGKLHGKIAKWDENGQLRLHLNFKNGKQNGEQLSWHENGQMNSQLNFNNGTKHGVEKTWDNQGKLIFECERKNGKFINSGFEYEDGKLKEAWFNLPNKEVKVAVGGNIVNGSSYEFYPQKTIFGPENDFEIGLNDKLSDEQILSYTKEILTTHFSNFDVILLGTRTSSTTGEEIVSIHPNYLNNGKEKITEIERITNLLLGNFSKIKIDGEQTNSKKSNSDSENQNTNNTIENNVVSLYKISDPDGYSNLRNAPNGEILQKVYENELFEVIGDEDGYKKVKLSNGTVGYIHGSRVIKN